MAGHLVAAPRPPDRRRGRRGRVALGALVAVTLAVPACASGDDGGTAQVPIDDLLATELGGAGSTITANRNAFGLPNRELPGDERGRFEVGDSFFTQKWVTAPASTTVRDGLGPLFNAEACGSCHVRDGRAEPPDDEHPERPGLLLRLSVPDEAGPGGAAGDPGYGGQLQDKAILGVAAEGAVRTDTTTIDGTFADGTPYSLLSPTYTVVDPGYGELADDIEVSPRIAPPTIGMGLLEAVPEADIVAAADPGDDDGDGISGRPNRLRDPDTGLDELGRFGWKANVGSVAQQTVNAFHGDLGVTSSALPDQECTEVQTACRAAVDGGDPEIDDQTLDAVVFYTRVLAVPERRPAEHRSDSAGAETFRDLGCASCHTPTFTTGDSDIPALADQTIHPYTDLLLHDMGDDLADGRPDHDATGSEWRTPPLWGIGLTETVSGHTRFLHDGRARDVTEAILWHGGEAEAARDAFTELDATERRALLDYLDTL